LIDSLHKLLLILILSLIYVEGSTQELNWHKGNWESIVDKAQREDKLIFLDFYTTWCGPCIRMDKSVFSDPFVQEFFMTHFISVKVDAEDNGLGSELARRHGIKAYPGLLFLDGSGTHISLSEGYRTAAQMLSIGRQVVDFNGQDDYLSDIKSNVHEIYSIDELGKILDLTLISEFDGKEHLVMQYLDAIEVINERDLQRIMGSIAHLNVNYLERLAPLTLSLSYYDISLRRDPKAWMKWKTDIERSIYHLLEESKNDNDLTTFEKTLELLKSSEGINKRQVDNYYLSFYKQNSLDQYRQFATYLIEEHIIPARPEDVRVADEEKYQLLRAEIEKDMNASGNLDISVEERTLTPTIDSLSEIYTISKGIADQLYEISSDFFAFYEDDSSRRKASFWASLAHLYFPYDWKYYDNHLYILDVLGKTEESQEVRRTAMLLPWYSEMRVPRSF